MTKHELMIRIEQVCPLWGRLGQGEFTGKLFSSLVADGKKEVLKVPHFKDRECLLTNKRLGETNNKQSLSILVYGKLLPLYKTFW